MKNQEKIYLIHAVDVSIAPSKTSFTKLWPDARISNILEESLASDLKEDGGMTDAMKARFKTIGNYCADAGATAILFTCSAFGSAIEEVKAEHPIPILTPNEALFEEVLELGGKIALLTTFEPSVAALRSELAEMSKARNKFVEVDSVMVPGALDALRAGNQEEHNRLIANVATAVAAQNKGYSAIVFGQFSMSPAAAEAQKNISIPVLTTPDCAVRKLKQMLI